MSENHFVGKSHRSRKPALSPARKLKLSSESLYAAGSEVRTSRAPATKGEAPGLHAELLDCASEGAFVLDTQGRILDVNRAGAEMLGAGRDTLHGRTLSEFVHHEDLPAFNELLATVVEGGHARNCRLGIRPEGLPAYAASAAIRAAATAVHGQPRVLFLLLDVVGDSFQPQSEKSPEALARGDSVRGEEDLLMLCHRERQQVAQDLHDVLGPSLSALNYLADALARRLLTQALAEEAKAAGELQRLAGQATSQARTLAQGLMPLRLEPQALVTAMREMAANMERVFGIACRLDCAKGLQVPNAVMATHLYHIAQEAIRNAIRHGKARQVSVELAGEDGRIRLSIRDEGIGLSGKLNACRGLGLRIMDCRAASMNGSLEVMRGSGGGTTVTCIVPTPLSRES